MKSKLKIIAVDDHPIFLKGLADVLKPLPFVERVDTCLDYPALKEKLHEFIPDVLFLDLNLPNQSGFVICQEIKKKHPGIFVAIVTTYDMRSCVNKAKDCGAGAYFLKNTDGEVYAEFLSDVRDNQVNDYYVYFPPASEKRGPFLKDGFELKASLTRRERQVMKLIVSGKGHKEIEAALGIKYDTYRMYHHNILTKLNVKNDVELVRFADKHLTDIDY